MDKELLERIEKHFFVVDLDTQIEWLDKLIQTVKESTEDA